MLGALLRTTRPMPAIGARFNASLIEVARAIKLNTLQDNPGTRKDRIRVGRGPGTGKGKTSGRGHGGQKARAGNTKPRLGFEGGQTPLFVRIPKRGFANAEFRREFTPLNLVRLQEWISQGRINAEKPITMKTLLDSGCVTDIADGVKLLGDGGDRFVTKVNISVSKASASAIARIEELGGSITATYYNRLGLRALLHPDKFTILPKSAKPTLAKDIAFYSNLEKRGYLAKPAQEQTQA